MTQKTAIHDMQGIETLRKEFRIDPHLIRRLRIDFFKHFRGSASALEALPTSIRESFAKRVDFHPLESAKRFDSQQDGASKILFQTRGGQLLESVVLRAETGRVTLCVSSQVGCAAACAFCATGKMGIAIDLTAAEIIDQLVQASEQLRTEGKVVRNVVFMGMGEPFHNEAEVFAALDAMQAPSGLNYGPGRILVSSVGLPVSMLRCATRFPRVNLALSLHSVRQSTRERLIPLARLHPVDELREALVALNQLQQQPVMIEHLLLEGENDSLEEAAELVAWLTGLRVYVNLIPYNPIEETPWLSPTSKTNRLAFAAVLKAAGFPTTMRYSMGRDIEAACGQLVRHENRTIAAALRAESRQNDNPKRGLI
jgi:23S rRNA (adenine2503-C2)-methyltransferase